MLFNQLKIAFRNLWWNKTYSLINISGLAIGLAICLVIFLFVQNELSYNSHIEDLDHIYRVTVKVNNPTGTEFGGHVPYPMGAAIKNDFPSIPLVSQTHNQGASMFIVGDTAKFEEAEVLFVDPEFAEIFNLKFLKGSPQSSLGDLNKVVLSETVATKYFGSEDPIGKIINIENNLDLMVSGVVTDAPENTNLPYDVLISYLSFPKFSESLNGNAADSWGWTWAGTTWIKVDNQAQAENVDAQLTAMVKKYKESDKKSYKSYHLFQASNLHFDDRFSSDTSGRVTSKSTIWSFSLIAILIFVIGCINFINLATAQAVKRSREVGIRKVLGSFRSQLIRQFLVESSLVAVIGGMVSLIIAEWSLSFVNNLLSINLQLNPFANPMIFVILIGLMIIIGILAGFYPAFVLSSFSPISALKNMPTSYKSNGFNQRRGLVIVQFTITQILIIGTLVVANQMDYLNNTDLGFHSEAILNVPIPDNEEGKVAVFKQKIKSIAGIEAVSFASGPPISNNTWTTRYQTGREGDTENYPVELKFTDEKFISTYQLELLAGELPRKASFDTIKGYVVNESLVRQLGIKNAADAIGVTIIPSINGGTKAPITGVVKDFHNYSLYWKILPVIMLNIPDMYYQAGLKVNTAEMNTILPEIESVWTETFPEYMYSYFFLDEKLAEVYEWENTTFKGFQLAAILAILVASLGLYGLISFMAAQRTKEIGIRKILGAGTKDILLLLSGEFTKLIAIAFVISAPIAWYLMDEWLQNFAYKSEIGISIFLTTLFIAFVLTWITIGFKTYRVASLNPVNTIKNE